MYVYKNYIHVYMRTSCYYHQHLKFLYLGSWKCKHINHKCHVEEKHFRSIKQQGVEILFYLPRGFYFLPFPLKGRLSHFGIKPSFIVSSLSSLCVPVSVSGSLMKVISDEEMIRVSFFLQLFNYLLV